MKSPLNRFRGLAGLKHVKNRDKRQRQPMAQWEEIAQADQEMLDMKDCYEGLLSAAAATTNSVYEFSESLKEIGDCLLEKTALSDFDDEESGKVLLMLGKVQLELQRRVNVYVRPRLDLLKFCPIFSYVLTISACQRTHISRTITVPSEYLLNELQIVEEMKSQCEAKRLVYEEALKKHKEIGKLKSGKVDRFPSQNLQAASDDYDQEVNSLLFRMRSLKQGQYRSLLTQAARHHAAQLSFFKKSYLALEEIEPYVKSVSKDHHIDYEFSGLEDYSGDDDDDDFGEDNDGDVTDSGSSDDSELNFGNKQDHPRHYTSKPMEDVEQLSPDYNIHALLKDFRPPSMSAPLFSDRRSDPNYKPIQMRPSSSQKHATYALPTPPEAKSPVSAKSKVGVSEKSRASLSSLNSYYSSPLDRNKYEKLVTNGVVSGPLLLDAKSVLGDSNQNIQSHPLPPLLLNGSPPRVDPSVSSNPKKVKRYAFSGPITGKQWQHKPTVTASGPIGSAGHSVLLHLVRDQPLSTTKFPSHTSRSLLSSPKISELHELPRPPPHLPFKRSSPHFDYSEPLRPKGTELSTGNKVVYNAGFSALLVPPPLNRSFSIPTNGQITEPMAREIPAPPTPIPELRMQPATHTT